MYIKEKEKGRMKGGRNVGKLFEVDGKLLTITQIKNLTGCGLEVVRNYIVKGAMTAEEFIKTKTKETKNV